MLKDRAFVKKVSSGQCSEEDVVALYRMLNEQDQDLAKFRSDIAHRAAEFGYFKWPLQIQRHIRGKRVLDVGCGAGMDAIGFITLGAREYVGIDPTVNLDSDVVKNRNGSRSRGGRLPKLSFGWTPNDISAAFPQLSFFKGTFEELREQRDFKKFDVISLYTVTEHLMQIDEVFEGCASLLKDNGKLIYYHHNYYCWNGHHMLPKRVSDLDENDPEQQQFMDWRHVLFDPPEDHLFRRWLNRIRLDELKAVTGKHFSIQKWQEIEDKDGRVRLTDAIRQELHAYSERELTTAKVLCIAHKR